jgi:hypothetical protein
MTPEESLAIRDSLKRIERSLLGDPDMGHRGLVDRLSANEAEIKETKAIVDGLDRKLLKWGGVVTGISLAVSYFKNGWFGK